MEKPRFRLDKVKVHKGAVGTQVVAEVTFRKRNDRTPENGKADVAILTNDQGWEIFKLRRYYIGTEMTLERRHVAQYVEARTRRGAMRKAVRAKYY